MNIKTGEKLSNVYKNAAWKPFGIYCKRVKIVNHLQSYIVGIIHLRLLSQSTYFNHVEILTLNLCDLLNLRCKKKQKKKTGKSI